MTPEPSATTSRSRVKERAAKSIPTLLGLGLFSLFYYFDVIMRATAKLLWCDEILTYYVCNLRDMRSVWAAATHGADLNPPLFYILTRASERLFGDGLIGIRVPEIVGFWLFCICLYAFVSRRSGTVAGIVAGFFPLITGAKYYAYEARPYGHATRASPQKPRSKAQRQHREPETSVTPLGGICLFRRFQDAVVPKIRIEMYSEFLATHRRFLVYSGVGVDFRLLAQLSTERGAIITDARHGKEQTLYQVQLR